MSHCVCLCLCLVCLFFLSHISICLFVNVFAAVGGMGGIKRPADGPTEEPSGKKNQPVASKVFPSSKPARENSPPPSSNITRPPPSPKQTRKATQVIFAALVLYTSYESNLSDFGITLLTRNVELCQAKHITDDPNTYKALLLCLHQTAIAKQTKNPALLQITLQQVW